MRVHGNSSPASTAATAKARSFWLRRSGIGRTGARPWHPRGRRCRNSRCVLPGRGRNSRRPVLASALMSNTISAPAAAARAWCALGVVDAEVADLGFDAADLVGLHHQLAEGGLLDRSHHHHAIAERELGVQHRAVVVGDDAMLLEAECIAQPLDRGRNIAIAHGRNDRRARLWACGCTCFMALPPLSANRVASGTQGGKRALAAWGAELADRAASGLIGYHATGKLGSTSKC